MNPQKNPIQSRQPSLSRRTFLQGLTVLGSGTCLAGRAAAGDASLPAADAARLPRRILGRTQQEVSVLTLGTWPCGKCETVDTSSVAAMVREAVDLGITMIDTARAYGNAEEGIGRALGSRRDQVLLTTKVWADTAEQARESLETSMRLLRTDHVDLVYLHSLGNRDLQRLLAPDGALSWLVQQKQAGKTRFLGVSGHSMVRTFVPILETGHIDVVLMPMNFVDRHTYGFEETVLPAARRLGVGVACMKVFGGIRGGFGVASGPNPGPELEAPLLEQAIRYALGLPGVATLVIGPHTVEQLRQNVRWIQNAQPLSADEEAALLKLGKQLARKWGPHYGPVA